MSDISKRDAVWDAVLRALSLSPLGITKSDVDHVLEAEVTPRTIKRGMEGMRELGWLQKTDSSSHTWYPGPKAMEYLAVYNDDADGQRAADLEALLETLENEEE
jgi:DNA-binding IclR family transcriptional regulator